MPQLEQQKKAKLFRDTLKGKRITSKRFTSSFRRASICLLAKSSEKKKVERKGHDIKVMRCAVIQS